MTDRELLELAAKAAGFRRDFQWNCRFLPSAGGSVLCGNSWTKWNPLEDDGDALRLAVELKLSIFPPEGDDGDFAVASVPDGVLDDFGETWIQKSVKDGDKLAATRRAIVRAAAEIGRQMP